MADVLLFPGTLAEPALPPDAEARAAALDVHRSFLVEAPAGSGKTGLLIQRYLKLLADESVTMPEQVLAITFTNKATAELRDRVLAQLELASLDPAPLIVSEFERETRVLARAVLARDRELEWSLLTQPHRLHLRTIDSVCMEIARTLPILSGSGGRMTPATDAAPLHREAAHRTLLLLGSGDAGFDEALRNLLLHRDGNLAECESLLADMLSLRDQWGRLIPLTQHELTDALLDADVLPRLERALDHAICAALTNLASVFPPHLLSDLSELAADMAHAEGYRGELSPIAGCMGRPQAPAAMAENLEHWRAFIHLLVKPSKPVDWRKSFAKNHVGFEIEKRHAARMKELVEQISGTPGLFEALCAVDQLPPAKYPAEQWAVAKSLFRVLSRALVELQLVFVERGECDFTQLGLLAHHALEQSSGAEDLAAALGGRLQHLLVDEMQDTSTSQYDLIERLTATWDGHSQTVFLVGDPHQSIYLFRQARVERFIEAMHTRRLGDLPLTRLQLTANFRSQRALVDAFNHDFSLIFGDGAQGGGAATQAAPYTAARATLPLSLESAGAVWHPHILAAAEEDETSYRSTAKMRRIQASEDADEILRIAGAWLAKPLPPDRSKPWSIAVLVRGRNHLTEIVAALRQLPEPLPFRAVEIEALNERQEILDLTALTRALLHPADRVAGLAVLRAPWCGLSLADLYTLTGGDDATLRHHSIARLMSERGHLLADDACERMERVWNVMKAVSMKRATLTTAQLVERAWLSLGGDAWLSAAQLTNTNRFFQLLSEIADNGHQIDSASLNARLKRLYAEPDSIRPGTGYIELLTIHKAKGLEWDVVLVPALERSVGGNDSRLLTWSEIDCSGSPTDNAAHIMLAPIAARGEEGDTLTAWLKRIHRAREAAETKRLFYVACTRAREELHLFAAPQLTAKGLLNPGTESLLKAAWPAAERHFAQGMASASIANGEGMRGTEDGFEESEPEGLEIAAAGYTASPVIQRVPAAFNPAVRFSGSLLAKLPSGKANVPIDSRRAQFSRPEGSYAARSFGNMIHACLDLLPGRILLGDTVATLLDELPAWTGRFTALLRSDGLPRPVYERLARDGRATLEKVLREPNGRWLLSAHARAQNEFAITSVAEGGERSLDAGGSTTTIRADRIFEAGSEPSAPGDSFLWIVDYKTGSAGADDPDEFSKAQRAAYGAQLETYARVLGPMRQKRPEQIRLALYFPTIPRLLWWQPEGND